MYYLPIPPSSVSATFAEAVVLFMDGRLLMLLQVTFFFAYKLQKIKFSNK
jgi:flagellar biogenesis protein FliO